MERYIWVYLILAFLLGWVVEYLIDLWHFRRKQEGLNSMISELRGRLDVSSHENKTWRERYESLDKTLERKRGEVDEAKAELARSVATINDRENELNSLRTVFNDTEAELASANELSDDLRRQLKHTRETSQQYVGSIEEFQARLDRRTKELNDTQASLKVLNMSLNEANTQIDQLTSDLNEAREQQHSGHETLAIPAGYSVPGEEISFGENNVHTAHSNHFDSDFITLQNELDEARFNLSQTEADISGLKASLNLKEEENSTLRKRASELDAALSEMRSEVANLQGRLTHFEQKPAPVMSILDTQTAIVEKSDVDELQKIRGIGKVYSRMLNDAGVFTFHDLSLLSAENLTKIIDPKPWQAFDPDKWINEARRLSHR